MCVSYFLLWFFFGLFSGSGPKTLGKEKIIEQRWFSDKSLRQRVIKSELKFHGQWKFKNWNFSISELNRSTNIIGTSSFHVWIYSDINNWRSKNRWTSLSPSVKFCQFSLLKIALSGILIWKNRSILNLSFRTFWTMLKIFVSLTILSRGSLRKNVSWPPFVQF